jgi:glutaredoxin-related protein
MIKIYYLEFCPYSQQALKILDKYKIEHHKIESSNNKNDRKQFYPTFPQIYWNENLIGGYSEISDIINNLQHQNIPLMENNWEKRQWLNFLIDIANKL